MKKPRASKARPAARPAGQAGADQRSPCSGQCSPHKGSLQGGEEEMSYTLYHCPGTGSDIALNALRACGARVRLIEVDYEKSSRGKDARLKKVNALSRLPTLVLPNGDVLTESGAILLHLAAKFPRAGLAPEAGTPAYNRFLRLLFLLTGEIYPCFTFRDDPSEWVRGKAAQGPYVRAVEQHRDELWLTFDSLCDRRGPWALGRSFSGIDLYLASMTQWRPRMEWFRRRAPRLAKIGDAARARATSLEMK